jgi:hypothetical protein
MAPAHKSTTRWYITLVFARHTIQKFIGRHKTHHTTIHTVHLHLHQHQLKHENTWNANNNEQHREFKTVHTVEIYYQDSTQRRQLCVLFLKLYSCAALCDTCAGVCAQKTKPRCLAEFKPSEPEPNVQTKNCAKNARELPRTFIFICLDLLALIAASRS